MRKRINSGDCVAWMSLPLAISVMHDECMDRWWRSHFERGFYIHDLHG